MKLILASIMIGSAAAICAETCNGHGKCAAHDKCICYDNWTGPSCKDRVCPYSHSWAGKNSHGYAECGNKGDCDRGSGVCKCYDGFTGKGCDRLNCVGDGTCSGHGTCERFGDVQSATYAGWDKNKIMVCKCDPGYTGPACESRMCKPGDDIMTPAGAPHKVTLTITGDSANPSGQFYLSFEDWRGQIWNTWALECEGADNENKPIGVEEALEALPNHAVPDVNVSHTRTGNAHVWVITFVSSHNTGDLSGKLKLHTTACTVAGCQPFITGLTGITSSVVDTVKGGSEGENPIATQRAVCSNRGECEPESGICNCVDGFYGEACEKQTIIL